MQSFDPAKLLTVSYLFPFVLFILQKPYWFLSS